MRLVQFIFLPAMLLFCAAEAGAQYSTNVPLSDEVVSGKLGNGMKYYILHNQWPKERVSFYFAQNVGAILEEDDQNGLAHFLEHMAFNGTRNFEGKGIIGMLEKNGVRFGSDINAYTAEDQTVYNISNVPAKNTRLIDSCLLVLHDWSGFLSLKDSEIDAERGVIKEEWRTRNTADFRLRTQTNKILFKNSKYAQRDVIGDMNIIDSFKYETLRKYYRKWYRPDLQSVIVVGDVDAKDVEQKIIKLFSKIEMPQNPAERYYAQIPDNKGLDFILAKDKEAKNTKIALYNKSSPEREKNWETFHKDLVNRLCINMLNRRFNELLQKKETSCMALGAGNSKIGRLKSSFNLVVIPKNGSALDGFTELMREMERAARFGYTQKELGRSKQSILSSSQNLLKNKDKISSDDLAGQLAEYFFTAEPFISPEKQYNETESALKAVTIADVNLAVKKLQTADQLLTVTGPDNNNARYPSKKEFLDIMEGLKKMPLEKYKDIDVDRPLVDGELKGSEVLESRAVNAVSGANEYVLGNGAKIILYPTSLAKDEVLFSAFSKGGSSLIKSEDIPSSRIAVNLVEKSGLGFFRSIELSDKLNGRIVSITPFINDVTEGFQGASNQKDMETMLQLLYLYFEHPKFDRDSYSKMIADYKNTLDNSQDNNLKIFQDTISQLNSNHNSRVPLFSQKFLERIEFEKAERIYRERFKNASDFTFLFVGNIPQNALELVKKYIGSISSQTLKEENYEDHRIEPADGVAKQLLIRDMDVPKASVYLKLSSKSPYTLKEGFMIYIVSELLSKKYLELIREEEGGSYGVDVFSSINRLPQNTFSITVSFDSAPEKQAKLTQIVYRQIEAIQRDTADPLAIESIKSSILKSRAERILSNGFWLSSLSNMKLFNEEFNSQSIYKSTLESITPQDIRSFAQKFFKDPKAVEVIMKSKGTVN